MDAIGIGLIGLGYWGPNYARVVTELGETEFVRACDRSEGQLELLRGRDVRLGTDVGELLADPEVEAVIISTPTSTHAELAIAALQAGKHVLCEKPLATSVAECDAVQRAADAAGRILMVGHTFLFNPAVRLVRDLIADGELGDVLYCHASRTGLGPIRQDVNALWDLAPHDISMLLAMSGQQPVEVSATGGSYLREGTEDVVFASLRMSGGVIANVHVSWLDPHKVRRMTVIGDRRMVVFDDVTADEKVRIFDKGASYEAAALEARGTEYGEYRAVLRDGGIVIPKVPSGEPLKEQVRHFATCCADGSEPETDGAAGRAVVAVLEAATASLREGGVPVAVAGAPDARPVA